jgi:hypothetical protein
VPPRSTAAVSARGQLSPAGVDGALGDVATAADGRALVLWRSGVLGADPAPGAQPHLFGNVRAAGAATFGAAETISGDTRAVLSAPTAAIDPQTRGPIALFTDFTAAQPLVSVRAPAVP